MRGTAPYFGFRILRPSAGILTTLLVIAASISVRANAAAADAPFDVVITAQSTPVMDGGTTIGELPLGVAVSVRETNADWYLVGVPNADPPLQGWIDRHDVQASTPAKKMPTPDERAQLNERDRIVEKSCDLRAQGKLQEAIVDDDKATAIDRKVLGNDDPDTLVSIGDQAGLRCRIRDFTGARKLCEEVFAADMRLFGPDNWRTADAKRDLKRVSLVATYDTTKFDRWAAAERQFDVCFALFKAGKFTASIPVAEQLVELRRKISESDMDYAMSLQCLAQAHNRTGDLTAAKPLFEQALELTKSLLGEKNPQYAAIESNVAYLDSMTGDLAAAAAMFRGALLIDLQATGEWNQNYASVLSSVAVLYDDLGQFDKAAMLDQRALAIRKVIVGESSGEYATSMEHLAQMFHFSGRFAKAEVLFKQAMAIDKASLGEMHPYYAGDLNNLAALYFDMGALDKAKPLYQRSLEITKQTEGEKHPNYASSLSNLARLYCRMGDYRAAEPLCKQALEIDKQSGGANSPMYAIRLNNLACLYQDMGETGKAETLYLQALEIRKHVLGQSHHDYAVSLNNLGSLYESEGDLAKAVSFYEQACKAYKKSVGDLHPDYATALHNLACAYDDMGDHTKAEPLHREVLEIDKRVFGETNPEYAASLMGMAMMYVEMADDVDAVPLLRQVILINRHRLDLMANIQSERQQLIMAGQIQGFLGAYISAAGRANVPADEIYGYVLSWKAAVLARQEAMRRLHDTLSSARSPAIAALFNELAAASRELSNRSQVVPEPGTEDAHQKKVAALSDRVEELESELASQSQAFRDHLEQQRRTPDDIRRALPPGAVLVDLLEYNHVSPPTGKAGPVEWSHWLVAFIVRRDAPVERIDLGPMAPIERCIDAWRKTFGMRRADAGPVPAAELRRQVWDKLAPSLVGAKLVLFSPDGNRTIPLAALPGDQPGTYLLEEIPIAIVPVPRLLPELLADNAPATAAAQPLENPGSLLLVGDVDFDADPGGAKSELIAQSSPHVTRDGELHRWPALPGTRAEIVTIADSFERAFPGRRLTKLRDTTATKGAVISQINQYRYLHFATHGFFAPAEFQSKRTPASPTRNQQSETAEEDISSVQPGLLSGLVLAGANRISEDGKDNGILTALEVGELDLSHVDLATLSACQTGLGETAGGEGLLGLQRAFQISGARSVVATLWTIRDDASRSLMIDFYDNLWKKKLSKLESLRQAQLAMLRDGIKRGLELPDDQPVDNSRRLPPYYWAAFVLSGDWR